MEKIWYKNAIFYSLDVESFYDSNGDGIGDFQGLTEKLEYIASLGVDCIWLLPFYPSPNHDNGYDVTDYYSIDKRLGNLGDFALFLQKADQLGLRVIIDLVVNHTSIQHPWFQEAVKDKNSSFRDFYIWSDEPLEYEKEHLMFHGEEDSIWHFHEQAGQYYLHRFYKEQPDLNISNPRVREEILKIMTFWMRMGIHGFRIDAAEMIVEPYALQGVDREMLFSFINQMRDYVQWMRNDALLIAEVNAGPSEMIAYMEKEDRMQMLFNFFLNQHIFLSLAAESKLALEEAMIALPHMGIYSQWLNFLRHHDELNLKQLTQEEQEKIFKAFAPDAEMRLYGFGIRRRLAPMMGPRLEKLKMVYSLMFSMPGTPMLRYGEEIGMGDNLSLSGRVSVRTPMQWSGLKNAGFSDAETRKLVNPIIDKGEFSFELINVLQAEQQAGSLLNWLKQLVSIRKRFPEIGFGKLFIVPHNFEQVLVHGFDNAKQKVLFIHNLSQVEVKLNITELIKGTQLFELFSSGDFCAEITMEAYGFKWFRTD